MNKNTSEMLGTDAVGKLMFKLALPAIIAQLINLLYNLVDRMYIGHIPNIGKNALTGVGVCMPLILIISAFAALASMGAAPRASIFLGKNDQTRAEQTLGNSLTLIIILSVVLTLFFQVFSEPLLMMFGASENTIAYAADYMKIYTLGTIFVQLTLGLNAFISAQGFAKMSMITVLIGAVLNTILDPIFIFGMNLGVSGAAWATVISQAVSAIWTLRFLLSEQSHLVIRKKNFALRSEILLPSIALGLAPFIMQFTESILAICFNASLLQYGGDLAVGAMTILMSVMQLSMLPLIGLTQGAQPIISYNYGSGNFKNVKKAFKLLVISCLIYATTMWSIVMIKPEWFIYIFNNDPTLVAFSSKVMKIYMAAVLLMGIQIACQQTLIALGSAKISVFLAVFRKIFLLIPLIYILPTCMKDQTLAVFLAEPIADITAVTVTMILFRFQFKKILDNKLALIDSKFD